MKLSKRKGRADIKRCKIHINISFFCCPISFHFALISSQGCLAGVKPIIYLFFPDSPINFPQAWSAPADRDVDWICRPSGAPRGRAVNDPNKGYF